MARALAAAVAALALTGTADAKPRVGGTVVVAVNDPSCLAACGHWDDQYTNQVLEGAFEVDGEMRYRPNLVSHVTMTRQPFTLTYHIRKEAIWSDGRPVTSRDFVFTFQTVVSGKLDSLGRPGFADLYKAKIRRVRPLDAKRFKVVFRARYSGWRDLFHVVFPRHALLGEDLGEAWRDAIVSPKTSEPIGSGPFLTEPIEKGRQLVLVRNPRYWGPHKAYLDRIVMRFVRRPAEGGTAQTIDALRGGEVHAAAAAGPQPEFVELRNDARFRVLSSAGMTWEHLTVRVRGGHPALENRLVRQALAYGLDREELTRRLVTSMNPALRALHNVVFVPNQPFYEPHWNQYGYDRAQARRLLERAGCRRGGDGIYECGGKRLSLRVATSAGNPRRQFAVELIQRQLREIGIEVVPVFAPVSIFLGVMLPAGDFDLALFVWSSDPNPVGIASIWRCGHIFNYAGYCNRQLTAWSLETELVLDPRAQAALLNRIGARLATDVPIIPLYQLPALVVVSAKLRNVTSNPTPEGYFWNTEDWWLER